MLINVLLCLKNTMGSHILQRLKGAIITLYQLFEKKMNIKQKQLTRLV